MHPWSDRDCLTRRLRQSRRHSSTHAAYVQADTNPAVSALDELERTREALADSQIQLHELKEKLNFVEQLLERDQPPPALPQSP